jgi:hypothetical protein
MPPPKKPENGRKSRLGVGTAAAGGGTLLVLLAQNLPESSAWKSWSLIAAPTVSIVLGAFFTWIAAQVKQSWNDARFASAVRAAKARVQVGLANQSTSAAHKEVLREQLEGLERMDIDNQMGRVQALANTQERMPNNRPQRTR